MLGMEGGGDGGLTERDKGPIVASNGVGRGDKIRRISDAVVQDVDDGDDSDNSTGDEKAKSDYEDGDEVLDLEDMDSRY